MANFSKLHGQIERITFSNDETGFTVAKLKVRNERDPQAFKAYIPVEEILEEGSPAYHAIVEKVKDLGVDVVVIATHGRTILRSG